MNNEAENTHLKNVRGNDAKIINNNSELDNSESIDYNLTSSPITSTELNLVENNQITTPQINSNQQNPKSQTLLYHFWQFLPRKLIFIYLALSSFTYLIQIILSKFSYPLNMYLSNTINLCNLPSFILNFLILTSCLKNLNKLTTKNLNLNLGFNDERVNTYSKISISLIILSVFFNFFVSNYHDISQTYFLLPIAELHQYQIPLIPKYIFNNTIYLAILKTLTQFSLYCAPRIIFINCAFTLSWLYFYFRPLKTYYNKFIQLYPYRNTANSDNTDETITNTQLITNKLYKSNNITGNITGIIIGLLLTTLLAIGIMLPDIIISWWRIGLDLAFVIQLGIWLIFYRNIKTIKLIQEENKNIKTEEKNEIIIPYQLNSGLEKWLMQRFNLFSPGKQLIVSLMLISTVFTSFVQNLLLLFAESTNSIYLNTIKNNPLLASHSITNSLNPLSLLFIPFALILILIFKYIQQKSQKPQFIKLNRDGIAFGRKLGNLSNVNIFESPIYWDCIQSIKVNNESKDSLNKSLVFNIDPIKNNAKNSQAKLINKTNQNLNNNQIKINLMAINDLNHRELILKAIEKYGNQIPRDASVIEILQPPSEHSYTDMWLESLTSPPKRNNFKPLDMGNVLKDKRYKINNFLGSGGHSVTYLAHDNIINEEIVLKEFILPVFVDLNVRKEALNQFEAEARILKKINHPQIVKLLDYFIEDHRAYLVLEYIQGITLKEFVLQNGSLPEDKVINICQQLCNILNYLHNENPPIIHRDLTPDNILYQVNGNIKIIDFNVAKQSDSVTIVSKVVGKHAYMPPEQFQGLSSIQSDIYSLGASLYYLLIGQEPLPISQSNPQKYHKEISDKLNNIVLKATAVKVDNRYKNVNEIITDLNLNS